MINLRQAIDEIYGDFLTAWNANAAAIVGYIPEARYENVEVSSDLDMSKYWVRLSVKPVTDEQATLRNANFGQCYDGNGIIIFQLFGPKSIGDSNWDIIDLAQLIKNTFRAHSTAGNVWFRNTREQILDPEPDWYRINVVSEYQFRELKS